MRWLPRILSPTLTAGIVLLGGWVASEPIRGVGATLPKTVYAEWARVYEAKTHVAVSYSAVPPTATLGEIASGQADFGASEVPHVADELAAKGLVQFPTVIGGVVPVVNVPGVAGGTLRLTGPVLADIFLGQVKTWDDAAIKALNGGLDLPARPIKVVHPGEASGSTYIFTTYLSSVSPEWKRRVGRGFTVVWPVGEERAGRTELGAFVQRTFGAISFVDFAHAADEGLARAKMQNREGEFVSPNVVSFQAAAANAPWESAAAFGLLLVDVRGRGSWPLTAPVFALVPHAPKDPARALEVLRFFDWTFKNGTRIASEAGYVALPPAVTTLVENAWRRQVKDSRGASIWTGGPSGN
jgi:phosphate transport system substrate-binding protein